MTTPSDTAIETASRALAHTFGADDCFECVDEWEALEDWEREAHPDERPGFDYEDCSNYRRLATAALSAAYPLIAAQAKAEALREAADEFGSWGPTGIAAANALRNRAATIETEGL